LLDRSGQGKIDGLIEWGVKTSGTMVPIVGTNAFQQTSTVFQTALNVNEKEYRGTIFGRMMRNIPIARDSYQNVVNGLGEEQPPDVDIIFSTEREGPNDKLWNLLSKNKQTTGVPTIKGVTVLDKEDNEVTLTPEQFYLYARSRGQYIAKTMNDKYDALSKMDEKEFAKAMSRIKSEGTAFAKATVENEAYGKDSPNLGLYVKKQIESDYDPSKSTLEEKRSAFESAFKAGNVKKAKQIYEQLPIEDRLKKIDDLASKKINVNFGDDNELNAILSLQNKPLLTKTGAPLVLSEEKKAYLKARYNALREQQMKDALLLDQITNSKLYTNIVKESWRIQK
jgi:hypothetical protein